MTFTAVLRTPLAKINACKKRMGWGFPWVSSYGSDFTCDYHVPFTPEQIAEGKAYYNYEVQPNTSSEQVGISVFYKNERSEVFHAIPATRGGVDMLNGAYHYLDLVPKGRDEDGFEFSMEHLEDGRCMPDMHYSAAQDASPLTGIVPMYLLMSPLHSAPWLKLVASRRSGAGR